MFSSGTENSCCGGEYRYANANQHCCQNHNGSEWNIIPKTLMCCSQFPYDNRTHYCYRKTRPIKLFFEVCGRTEYDVRDKVCCGTTLHNKSSDVSLREQQKCCGQDLIDHRTEQCCYTSDLPFKAHRDASCCGKGTFILLYQPENCL